MDNTRGFYPLNVGSIPARRTKNMYNLERRIVCAANLALDGTIILGVRHYDDTMRNHIMELESRTVGFNFRSMKQGFVNTWGEFIDRKDAWMIASHNKQIFRLCGSQTRDKESVYGTKLYSENLY